MKLIFADRNLERPVDSHTSWFQYVIPELQNYWITPEVWAHENFQGLDPLLVRTEFGQEIPKPLTVKTILGERGDLCFEQFPTGRNTCIFVRDADAQLAQAAWDWLKRIEPGEQPKLILEPSAIPPKIRSQAFQRPPPMSNSLGGTVAPSPRECSRNIQPASPKGASWLSSPITPIREASAFFPNSPSRC
jgi:hypothetical protein